MTTKTRPLRQILSLQSMLVAATPFLVAAALGIAWLLPQAGADVEIHQRQLAEAIAAQIRSYLAASLTTVKGSAFMVANSRGDWQRVRQTLGEHISASQSLMSLYAVAPDGRIAAVGIASKGQGLRQDLMGLDLSRNKLLRLAREKGRYVWSDTFLSVIGGGLSVALAVPAGKIVVIGEIELGHLTDFLKGIVTAEQQLILVIDRRGQVIADQEGLYTAQQLNISDVSLVKKGLASTEPQTGSFRFGGRDMIGSLITIPSIEWRVLVARPTELAYRALWSTTHVAVVGLLAAMLLGLSLALYLSRRLALRFERLAAHARRVSAGEEAQQWPKDTITEFGQLAADLQQMASAIRDREKQLFTLMSNLPGMVYRSSSDPGRKMHFVSHGCLQLTGYSPGELANSSSRSFDELIHPDDRVSVQENVGYHVRRGEPYQLIYRISTAEGQLKWVEDHGQGLADASGETNTLEGFVIDITRRKWAEESLKESEQRYRTLFERATDAILIVKEDGEIIDANPACCGLFGTDRNDLVGNNVLTFYANPSDRPILLKDIKTRGFLTDIEWRIRRKDGQVRTCLLNSAAWKDDHGETVALLSIARDVTDTRQLEQQLLQSQKMEAVGTLAGGIAHDFNNLLQVIIGYSDMLLLDKKPSDKEHEGLQAIRQAGRDGAELAKRILAFSRRLEPNTRPINLNNEIVRVQKMLARTVSKMIRIEILLADNLHTISADASQMEQILLNLVVNAQHAMPDGGKLTIETANVALDKDYSQTHLDLEPGEYVLLTVSDTGHGMDEEVLEHVFEPFYTTKEADEGTGLGLAMVFGVVKSHKGHIVCFSEPGAGTTFKIYLPAIVQEIEQDTSVTLQTPAIGTETILLVDDEEAIRKLGEQMLSKAGYTVLKAINGREALQVYRSNQDRIALVLLDLMMPEMGGKHCLEELLKINPSVRVVIASGYSARGQTKDVLAPEAKGFVDKPYHMRQLLETVRRVLDAG